MNSKTLYELTKDLFKKYPSAEPQCLSFRYPDQIGDELIITGHLTKWLAERLPQGEVLIVKDRLGFSGWKCQEVWKPTILEALISACMGVEQ